MEKQYPLIIVFYLDAELMANPQIIKPFADSVNDALAKRKANAIAFFIPTKGEERVECINPIMVKDADMAEINKMVEDIKASFSIGVDINVPDEEITLDEKPCECGDNLDGECKCD
ncbi:MAG: hypothetical protein WCK82_03345 [Bacteroidota bacterium]|jgi:hypothetical protein